RPNWRSRGGRACADFGAGPLRHVGGDRTSPLFGAPLLLTRPRDLRLHGNSGIETSHGSPRASSAWSRRVLRGVAAPPSSSPVPALPGSAAVRILPPFPGRGSDRPPASHGRGAIENRARRGDPARRGRGGSGRDHGRDPRGDGGRAGPAPRAHEG